MEIQRIQKRGEDSYVIALPREWINSYAVKEKDQISIMTQHDLQMFYRTKFEN